MIFNVILVLLNIFLFDFPYLIDASLIFSFIISHNSPVVTVLSCAYSCLV